MRVLYFKNSPKKSVVGSRHILYNKNLKKSIRRFLGKKISGILLYIIKFLIYIYCYSTLAIDSIFSNTNSTKANTSSTTDSLLLKIA